MSEVAELDHVRRLLDCIKVEHVVSVDDRHAPQQEVVLTLARELDGPARAELLKLSERAEAFEEFDIFRDELEALWDTYAPDRHTEIVQEVQRLSRQSDKADDTRALTKLSSLVPGDRFETVSLHQWDKRRDELIKSGQRALVLFDRDFSGEGGGAREGDKLLLELQSASEGKDVWTGLLTHTATPQEEHATYRELTETADPHRTVVISKARLESGEFPKHLRLTLLAPLMHKLVSILGDKIEAIQGEAIEEVKAALPAELESMVFGASQAEGVWEPETLLLLFGLVQRDKAREEIWQDDDVHEVTALIRCLNAVKVGLPVADSDTHKNAGAASDDPPKGKGRPSEPTGSKEADDATAEDEAEVATDPNSAPRFYQRLQIYEKIDVVNGLHMPVECGDVFDNREESAKRRKTWIVIAQPCDLALRADGKRGDFPITHVVVCPVERQPTKGPHANHFQLPHFDELGRPYVAKLNQARYQRVCLLDFCVFRPDGVGVLDVEDTTPERILEGWSTRHALLQQSARQVIELAGQHESQLARLKNLSESAPSDDEISTLASAILEAISTDHARPPFVTAIDPQTKTIDAGCQRVARLSADYARALLAAWGSHLTRPVLPYNLTRQPTDH